MTPEQRDELARLMHRVERTAWKLGALGTSVEKDVKGELLDAAHNAQQDFLHALDRITNA